MRNFYTFQKRKGFYLPTEGTETNTMAAHQINHELMNYGFIMTPELFNRVSTLSKNDLISLYNDVKSGLERVVGTEGYEPIYKNFPQSVLALTDDERYINAITHYWSMGTWRPEDSEYVNREFAFEPVDYKSVGLLTEVEYNSIFTDILYSGKSISSFDKEIVDWFIDQGTAFDMNRISFKETASYVGQRVLTSAGTTVLPTRDATQVLRIWSAYSGGDEGLKENTRFKNPTAHQRRVIMSTLDNAYNLEESFKMYREKWLRLLHFLHPMTKGNRTKYSNVYKYANALRNNPKTLRTFNSYVDEKIKNNDITVLDLLSKRMGAFTRSLDHMVRLFGYQAIEKWLSNNPSVNNMIDAYNHFTNRDKEQAGRGATLAYQGRSEVVTYDALEPLSTELVNQIKDAIMTRLRENKHESLVNKKVYIDRTLYYRGLKVNNRASSLTLGSALGGSTEVLPEGKVARMYVHWDGRSDIDLSVFTINNDNTVNKIGWNTTYALGNSIVYSGDNTGYSDQNAEYMDVVIDRLPVGTEWVITEARIFSGPRTFKAYNGGARAGWMMIDNPEANRHWQPKTISNAMVLASESSTAYISALHVPTRSFVYLDLSMGSNSVSTDEDALKMRMYLETFVTLDRGDEEIDWERINQGHLINLISSEIVENSEEADIVFDENSTYEEIAKYL